MAENSQIKDTLFCFSNENKFKIVLVGDSGVGKTSIFWQYIEEFFPDDVSELKVTMVDFKIKNIVIENELIKLYIWDTAGQERYRALVSNYFKGTHGIILIFDLGNAASFESIKNSWITICKDKSQDAQYILIGNKADLPKRSVSTEKIEAFLKQNNMPYFEVSAFDGKNVNEAFQSMAQNIKDKLFPKQIVQKGVQEKTKQSIIQEERQSICLKVENHRSPSLAQKQLQKQQQGGKDNGQKKSECC